jgi:hypothetical protein
MNMRKTSEVLQGPDESPSQFYECLCEAFRLCTPFDLEATESQGMINATFVGQAQGYPSSVSVAVVLTIIFAIGLAGNAPTDCTHGERFLLALFYLFWAGCIIAVYCY